MTSKEANDNINMAELGSARKSMSDAERGYAKLNTNEPSSDALELENLQHRSSNQSQESAQGNGQGSHNPTLYEQYLSRKQVIWDRLRGKGRRVPGLGESVKNVVFSSCESPLARLLRC